MTTPRVPRAALVVVALAVAALAAVAITAAVVGARWSSGDAAPPAALDTPAVDAPVLPTGDVPVRTVVAASPGEALDGFLRAEQDGKVAAGYDFLSDADRAAYRSPAGWEAAHAGLLPRLRGYELGGVTEASDRAEVRGTLRYTPTLDEFLGLVPAEATATWVVVREGDGWGVALDQSTITPVYAPDTDAPAAVESWAASRQRCATDGQRAGTLLGYPGLATDLCGTDGDVAVDAVARLPEAEASAFTAAFGGDVVAWARVVPVTAPVPLRAVVAPVGEQWLVIGVLGPGLGGT